MLCGGGLTPERDDDAVCVQTREKCVYVLLFSHQKQESESPERKKPRCGAGEGGGAGADPSVFVYMCVARAGAQAAGAARRWFWFWKENGAAPQQATNLGEDKCEYILC